MPSRIKSLTRPTAIACALFLASCSITRAIEPLPPCEIGTLYVLDNPDVHMEAFLPELQRQLAQRGIATSVFSGAPPQECRHRLEYTANWKWDMAMYVSFIELRVYDQGHRIGRAIYDARRGGGRLDKFGTTSEKLSSLIDPLFAEVAHPAPPSPESL